MIEQPDLFIDFSNPTAIAGIDEAGRGPIAGPVVAAAVIFKTDTPPDGLTDSKLIPKQKREELFAAISECCDVAVAQASVEEIDALNILEASLLAMRRAVEALSAVPAGALVDGNQLPRLSCPARAIIKGDLTVPAISAASICAKVTRDRLMCELARDFPGYGWERNAGYGTREHLEALNVVGISPFHRKTFAPVHKILTQESGSNC